MRMSEEASPIVTELIDSALIIRFNRPAERNPLSVEVLKELDKILWSLTASVEVRALIFTGTDDVFASGANIRELAALTPESAEAFSRFGQELCQRIADAGQLTIAAINGYCMGGAIDLALACKTRIASSNAVFAHPGARLGIITGWGGTQRLPRLIGRTRALKFFISARCITSQEAFEMGLITRISDPVLETALALGRETVG